MFDFVEYFNGFINNLPTKDKMIMKYINGEISKDELDLFMKGQKND